MSSSAFSEAGFCFGRWYIQRWTYTIYVCDVFGVADHVKKVAYYDVLKDDDVNDVDHSANYVYDDV